MAPSDALLDTAREKFEFSKKYVLVAETERERKQPLGDITTANNWITLNLNYYL